VIYLAVGVKDMDKTIKTELLSLKNEKINGLEKLNTLDVKVDNAQLNQNNGSILGNPFEPFDFSLEDRKPSTFYNKSWWDDYVYNLFTTKWNNTKGIRINATINKLIDFGFDESHELNQLRELLLNDSQENFILYYNILHDIVKKSKKHDYYNYGTFAIKSVLCDIELSVINLTLYGFDLNNLNISNTSDEFYYKDNMLRSYNEDLKNAYNFYLSSKLSSKK